MFLSKVGAYCIAHILILMDHLSWVIAFHWPPLTNTILQCTCFCYFDDHKWLPCFKYNASMSSRKLKLYRYSKFIVTQFSNKGCLCMHPHVIYFLGISIFNSLAMYIITSVWFYCSTCTLLVIPHSVVLTHFVVVLNLY